MRKIVLSLTGILILSIFVLAGCGSGPQQTSVADTGAFAVDFTKAPGVIGFIALGQPTDGVKSLEGKELTVEAWVRTNQMVVNKTSTPKSLLPYGTIFGLGSDFEGINLWINENQNVQFEMLAYPGVSLALPTFARSSTALSKANKWYHIAAVLVNEDHGDGDADDHQCTPSDRDGDGEDDNTEKPHIDIYMDGEFDNCGSAGAVKDSVTGEWSGGFTGPLKFVRSQQFVCASGADETLGVVEGVDYVIEDGVCYPLDRHLNKFKFGGTIGRSPSDWWWQTGSTGRLTPAKRFSGVIDEVRFWNVARTKAEINANKDKEIEPQDNLIGYWRFNEGSPDAEKGVGNIVVDSSGSGKGGVKMYCNVDVPSGDHIGGAGCSGPVANALPWYEGWVDLDDKTEKNWK